MISKSFKLRGPYEDLRTGFKFQNEFSVSELVCSKSGTDIA